MQNSQEVYPIGWELFDKKNKKLAVLRRKKEIQKQVDQLVEQKRMSDRTYSIGQGMITMAAIVFLITIMIAFLYQSQALTQNMHSISALKEQYEKLVLNNDDLEKQIEADIDYEAIYNQAVNEYGMTYPEKNQVIGFDKGEMPYVRQEEPVP